MSEDRLADLIYTLQRLRIAPVRLIYGDRFSEMERGQFLKAWYIADRRLRYTRARYE